MTDFETIVVALVEVNKKYPDLRFTQVLDMLDINSSKQEGRTAKLIENFYDEDTKVLNRVKEALKLYGDDI